MSESTVVKRCGGGGGVLRGRWPKQRSLVQNSGLAVCWAC
jgi:hypothetical protein